MRTTRNQAKRQPRSTGGEEETKRPRLDLGKQKCVDSVDDNDTLAGISHEAVGKLLKRFNGHGSRGSKLQESFINRCDAINKLESGLKKKEKQTADECSNRNITESSSLKEKAEGGIPQQATDDDDQMDEPDWEEGPVNNFSSGNDHEEGNITIEFEASPDTAKRKAICRASAEDKERAELVHKVHLLCLLGRGRLIDRACNDPLIQAALLSLVPRQFLKISETPKLTARSLAPLVNWFHKYFHVRLPSNTERSFESALALALETQEGTAEEVAALSVALFRALNLTTRFVSVLDVASLKPCVENNESVTKKARRTRRGIFNSSTLMVTTPDVVSGFPSREFTSTDMDNNNMCDVGSTKQDKWPKRIGDLEFEMQLEMAKAATESGNDNIDRESYQMKLPSNWLTGIRDGNGYHKTPFGPYPGIRDGNGYHKTPFGPYSIPSRMSLKEMRRIRRVETPASQGISVAIGSRKVGAPLYWAEVYCNGENLTGKWVHVDAVNAIIDGEQKVEAAIVACKTSLRYAVAFAGNGAKDVTRRYCMKWYKIASERINMKWWDAVLAPLKELEAVATENMLTRQEGLNKHEKTETIGMLGQSMLDCTSGPAKSLAECSIENSYGVSRSSLEDIELETRALTEPLPTNQQAYKNHPLYALERWLTKCQILHPRGPVLGFCSSHPVYPRTCVQVLRTKERWLREGLQLRANELPAKVLKRSPKQNKEQASEADDYDEGDNCGLDTSLYGEWQTEPLQLPHAVDGIVPRNERGQVDVWSEKCLPPGTVHLRFPGLVPIAERLKINFAPAMVGFEFRNGRSVPVYEGIVVCTEFKDAILEVYTEELERRNAEERRRNESQAISRWYQLLSSILTRQKLKNRYGDGSASQSVTYAPIPNVGSDAQVSGEKDAAKQTSKSQPRKLHVRKENQQPEIADEHEHVFLMDDQTGDEESSTRIKRCHCGFYIEVEVL
ncbi:DNA repair protein RAD4 [Heracleum sosnowskyi]|uniref:DNA repair protein RAD4 n=1 Tax=Heracleum sosnowskyi TaxID=360622 RepID=A0AAD8HP97_9APIA|nr:DNA repair protein RAD4 [Heracleum sosnowskyi]